MRRAALASLLGLALVLPLMGDYPLIRTLGPRDPLYKQLLEDIAQANMAIARKKPLPPLSLYSYVLPAETELIALASALSLPYETLATVNRIERSGALPKGFPLVIPNIPGVFVPEKAQSDLEFFLLAGRTKAEGLAARVALGKKATDFRFYPGDRLRATERAFFLNVLYRMPVEKAKLSSGFGYRLSPITGEPGMHTGIDLAAPEGTEVLAARDGTVSELGRDPVLGLYLVIDHGGSWQTVYGHLRAAGVVLHQEVKSGNIIGAVGSTGLSTGPHLHFEIRSKGEPKDPSVLLPGTKK